MNPRRPRPPDATGPVPLSSFLDETLERLRPHAPPATAGDALLFAGNPQEVAPRALFLDVRLTPLERNAWQVLRMRLNEQGMSTFTYEQLRPYLTSLPYSGQASEETVARALIVLRLARWLSLARRRRDPASGRVLGNLYVLHDEVLTPYEAIQLDPHYLELISHALTHASKTIQRVGTHALTEFTEDPHLTGHALPSRLALLVRRLAACSPAPTAPSSDSEDSETSDSDRLRNQKTDRTVRTVRPIDIYKERTVPRAREETRLRLPDIFKMLKPEQQTGALAALERVKPELRQPVLDEWAGRCQAATVRNPAGYLFGIIQKALRGEFNATKKSSRTQSD